MFLDYRIKQRWRCNFFLAMQFYLSKMFANSQRDVESCTCRNCLYMAPTHISSGCILPWVIMLVKFPGSVKNIRNEGIEGKKRRRISYQQGGMKPTRWNETNKVEWNQQGEMKPTRWNETNKVEWNQQGGIKPTRWNKMRDLTLCK